MKEPIDFDTWIDWNDVGVSWIEIAVWVIVPIILLILLVVL